MRIVNYFDPRTNFTACSDYYKLSHSSRGMVIALSIFAGMPTFGLGGIATFRALVERLKPLDSHTISTDGDTNIDTLNQVHLLSSKDDLLVITKEEVIDIPLKIQPHNSVQQNKKLNPKMTSERFSCKTPELTSPCIEIHIRLENREKCSHELIEELHELTQLQCLDEPKIENSMEFIPKELIRLISTFLQPKELFAFALTNKGIKGYVDKQPLRESQMWGMRISRQAYKSAVKMLSPLQMQPIDCSKLACLLKKIVKRDVDRIFTVNVSTTSSPSFFRRPKVTVTICNSTLLLAAIKFIKCPVDRLIIVDRLLKQYADPEKKIEDIKTGFVATPLSEAKKTNDKELIKFIENAIELKEQSRFESLNKLYYYPKILKKLEVTKLLAIKFLGDRPASKNSKPVSDTLKLSLWARTNRINEMLQAKKVLSKTQIQHKDFFKFVNRKNLAPYEAKLFEHPWDD